ncbi:MAG: alpha/beta hydrolase [Gammaproteobacteria bacterium]|nr:alpha/beta hydrolase [Gammaproteobacteria bacterium]
MTKNITPALVLLPGFDGTGRLFSPLHKQLMDSVNTIVLSYPNEKPMTYSELCHFLKDELPETPFVLLGESFGGPLAMLLSRRTGNNLKGIILCATFVKNPQVLLSKLIRPFLRPKHLRKETPSWYIKTLLTSGLSDTALIHNIQAATRELTREVYFSRLKEIADVDVTDILKNCELPILYLRASKDRLVYESSMRLIKKIGKNVTVQSFDAPHMLLQTKSEQAAQSIKKFLNEVIK